MDDPQAENRSAARIGVAILLAVAIGASVWWYARGADEPAVANLPPVETLERSDESAANSNNSTPQIANPISPPPGEVPVLAPPTGVAADALLTSELAKLWGPTLVQDWLISQNIARRIVATVDNLPRSTRIEALRPTKAPRGAFVVERETLDPATGAEHIQISTQNAARYDLLVAAVSRMDVATLVTTYQRVYPLLQDAYEDLGYPDRYFNDRLIETIDHLLQTPEPTEPLVLVQPKVMYQFENQELEARSSGQKLLLRMGVEHTRTIKNKLRQLRAEIAKKE